MITTQYMVITVLIVSVIVISGLNLWLTKAKYEISYSPRFLILFLLLPLIRLLLPFEFSFTRIIESTKIYPAIFYPLIEPLFTIGQFPVTGMVLLTFIWMGGFLGFFLHNCYCFFKIKRCFKNEAYCKDAKINVMVSNCLGKGRKILPVICTELVTEPMLMGGIKPTIILPDQPFAEDELHYILAHEVCHYKNNDLLIKYFTGLLSCLFWWIPQVHLLKRQLDCVLEIRADREVLHRAAAPQKAAYLSTLLKIQKQKNNDMRFPVGSAAFTFGDEYTIKRRFRAIVDTLPATPRQKAKEICIAAALSVVLLLPFGAVLQPRSNGPVEEGLFTVANGEVYFIQRGELYDLYINHEFTKSVSSAKFSEDELLIPIINKKDG